MSQEEPLHSLAISAKETQEKKALIFKNYYRGKKHKNFTTLPEMYHTFISDLIRKQSKETEFISKVLYFLQFVFEFEKANKFYKFSIYPQNAFVDFKHPKDMLEHWNRIHELYCTIAGKTPKVVDLEKLKQFNTYELKGIHFTFSFEKRTRQNCEFTIEMNSEEIENTATLDFYLIEQYIQKQSHQIILNEIEKGLQNFLMDTYKDYEYDTFKNQREYTKQELFTLKK